ncbi:hypothetical protein ACHAXM_009725 [Skeletonema potamos]
MHHYPYVVMCYSSKILSSFSYYLKSVFIAMDLLSTSSS